VVDKYEVWRRHTEHIDVSLNLNVEVRNKREEIMGTIMTDGELIGAVHGWGRERAGKEAEGEHEKQEAGETGECVHGDRGRLW
jgi:hypothetical protein